MKKKTIRKFTGEQLNVIRRLASDLKYWKLKKIEVSFEYQDPDGTRQYMDLDISEGGNPDLKPFIRRSSNAFYASDKIEPIVEGHSLLVALEKEKII